MKPLTTAQLLADRKSILRALSEAKTDTLKALHKTMLDLVEEQLKSRASTKQTS